MILNIFLSDLHYFSLYVSICALCHTNNPWPCHPLQYNLQSVEINLVSVFFCPNFFWKVCSNDIYPASCIFLTEWFLESSVYWCDSKKSETSHNTRIQIKHLIGKDGIENCGIFIIILYCHFHLQANWTSCQAVSQ